MQRIGFITFSGFGVMSFSALSVFESANNALGKTHYDVRLISEHGGPVRSSLGVVVQTEAFGKTAFDTVIIGGGNDREFTPGLLDYLRQAARNSRRLAATCSGTFFLAQAGLLDGMRATTHWFFAAEFRKRYPKVRLEEERLFIVDGSLWTSAGMTAGIDQALAMVEADLGATVARAVSKTFILQNRRAGGQPQSSALLDMEQKTDRIQTAIAYARNNLHRSLSLDELAEAAHLSLRQFSRAFRAQTGVSPAKAIEKLRIETALVLIQDGRHPIEGIARQTGFGDSERMRRAFIREFGKPPQVMRRTARSRSETAASGMSRNEG
ncbi:GlxA family transcriptional regulator [Pseudomonas sp. D8002]|jgi:transcriptional regulator GlxA family with amidase domain|uniref:GlxA family transcriptional regulator n=1 Tax=unclassified Pseudomonas TaxID=196821 RepID=UPI000272CC6A|nr:MULTISPECIES: GlxA family transcriptional regulator [unclassified Pseudomonas]QBQ14701.1 GlxA family transcriptional regulator [Pseudomonas sp. SXM-1]HEC53966.1 GlxA family transcriptional regulator [Gammaproteobacteria bacterium]EJF72478.1 AraC family transcriptional regulator [Pseudomonas sp. Ag1]NVZ34028.1 GlxA family transcriptional regulator [Pseudomonas sp. A4002]NWA90937.1 GlxA family transcriptional regulator [Pseudomonas sp. D8002]|eukprot:gene10514-16164_t